jgi:hypothetical protein
MARTTARWNTETPTEYRCDITRMSHRKTTRPEPYDFTYRHLLLIECRCFKHTGSAIHRINDNTFLGSCRYLLPVGWCGHVGGSCWLVPTCWWFLLVSADMLVVPVGRCLCVGGSCWSVSTCWWFMSVGVYVLMPSRCLRVGASTW